MQRYHSSDAREYIRLAKEARDSRRYKTAKRLTRLAEETEETWRSEEAGGRELLKIPRIRGLLADVVGGLASRDAGAYIAKASRAKDYDEKQRLWWLHMNAQKTYMKEHPCRVKVRGAA